MSEFQDLFGERVELEIENGGRPWRIVYDPSRWPVAHQVRAATEAMRWEEIIEKLAPVLVSWDLEIDGEPLPCNEDSLRLFPAKVLNQLHVAIFRFEAGIDPADENAAGKVEASLGPAGT